PDHQQSTFIVSTQLSQVLDRGGRSRTRPIFCCTHSHPGPFAKLHAFLVLALDLAEAGIQPKLFPLQDTGVASNWHDSQRPMDGVAKQTMEAVSTLHSKAESLLPCWASPPSLPPSVGSVGHDRGYLYNGPGIATWLPLLKSWLTLCIAWDAA